MGVINAKPAIPNRNWAATACNRVVRLCVISMPSTPKHARDRLGRHGRRADPRGFPSIALSLARAGPAKCVNSYLRNGSPLGDPWAVAADEPAGADFRADRPR